MTFGFQFQTGMEVSVFKIQAILHNFHSEVSACGHLVHVEITILKDRRMSCKKRDEYFSL